MKNECSRKNVVSTFTLIELLVVIGIIALLAALLLPAINGVRQQANRVRAKTRANNIVMAIKQYETTYGVLPVHAASNDKTINTGSEYDDLIAILAYANGPHGDRTKGNFRKTPFLGVPKSYDEKGYVDPWGNNYFILMDANYDNEITDPFNSANKLHGKVFVYSYGRNGKSDSGGGDDICSWQ